MLGTWSGPCSSRVFLRNQGVDPYGRERWPEQQNWLLDKLEAFHRAFAPRIKALKIGESEYEDY